MHVSSALDAPFSLGPKAIALSQFLGRGSFTCCTDESFGPLSTPGDPSEVSKYTEFEKGGSWIYSVDVADLLPDTP